MITSNSKYVYSGKAAVILDISNRTLVKWVEEGHLHCIRHGKNRRFSVEEIEKFKQSSFYRSRKPKYTLIYVRAKNSIDRRNLVDKAREYCQQNEWTEIAISESTGSKDSMYTNHFQQAFDYFFERKIERLICCESKDEVSRFFGNLVKGRGVEVLDLLNL